MSYSYASAPVMYGGGGGGGGGGGSSMPFYGGSGSTDAVNVQAFAGRVGRAVSQSDGNELASLFSKTSDWAAALVSAAPDVRPARLEHAVKSAIYNVDEVWSDMICQHVTALHHLSLAPMWNTAGGGGGSGHNSQPATWGDVDSDVYASGTDALTHACAVQNSLTTHFLRHFSGLVNGRWALPLLHTIMADLRLISLRLDARLAKAAAPAQASSSGHTPAPPPMKHLEECARQLNKAFTACVADRNKAMAGSRKWGTYQMVALVFRTYFKLKSINLCKNILRALSAAHLPPLEDFPRADRVAFRYYCGVLAFLNEEYARAEEDLEFAFQNCLKGARHNQRMILTYLIPAKLLRGVLPSPYLYSTQPTLRSLYHPLQHAAQRGDVRSYDAALSTPSIERALVKNGTYLAFERGREACVRGLLRAAWTALDRPTRIALARLREALEWTGAKLEDEEVEWEVAALIYKGYIRGYISHERQTVVLAATNPFPKLGTFTPPS